MAERDGIDSGGSTTDVDARWAAFAGWFAQRLSELPAASVLDAGRGDATPETDGYDVECAQVQRLYGDRYLLRCSTTLMIIPLLDCYDGDNVALDTWHHDDLFEDCTHGYLVSESPQMVADLVVGWFRERCRLRRARPHRLRLHAREVVAAHGKQGGLDDADGVAQLGARLMRTGDEAADVARVLGTGTVERRGRRHGS